MELAAKMEAQAKESQSGRDQHSPNELRIFVTESQRINGHQCAQRCSEAQTMVKCTKLTNQKHSTAVKSQSRLQGLQLPDSGKRFERPSDHGKLLPGEFQFCLSLDARLRGERFSGL